MAYVLILGATSDIARSVAARFAENGFDLILAARAPEALSAFAGEIRRRYQVDARTVSFDALDFDSHADFYASLPERPIGVVCAIGYMGEQKAAERNFREARKIIDTNYTGCVSILNVIAEDLEKRQEGFITGISSVAGERGRRSNFFYGSAKAGFTSFLSGLRGRLSDAGVKVITVKPGYVRTRMTEGKRLPGCLSASPDEVAEAVLGSLEKGKEVVYVKRRWKYIMWALRMIPEGIFKRLPL